MPYRGPCHGCDKRVSRIWHRVGNTKKGFSYYLCEECYSYQPEEATVSAALLAPVEEGGPAARAEQTAGS